MEIIASNEGGGNFKIVDAGNYVARCYQMIHIGTVKSEFNGEVKELNKVRLSWELPTEKTIFSEEKGEQPFSLSKEFTLSMHEKSTLRGFLKSWRGREFTDEEAKRFDILKLLGVPCMLNVIHKVTKTGKTVAEISSVSAMPKSLACDPAINNQVIFSIASPDWDVFGTLPQWLQDKIKDSKEYKYYQRPDDIETSTAHIDEPADDLPF